MRIKVEGAKDLSISYRSVGNDTVCMSFTDKSGIDFHVEFDKKDFMEEIAFLLPKPSKE